MARHSKMNIQALTKLTPKFWDRVASYSIKAIRERTDNGIGVRNNRFYRFGQYSPEYAKAKARGMTRLTTRSGNNKGTKYKGLKEGSVDRRISPPNFSLRGLTMKDLNKRRSDASSTTIGWMGEYADIVEWHEHKGKYVVGGLADKELEAVMVIMGKQFDFNWNKHVKNGTVTVNL